MLRKIEEEKAKLEVGQDQGRNLQENTKKTTSSNPNFQPSSSSSSSVTIQKENIQVPSNQDSVDQTHQMQSREVAEEVEHTSSCQAAQMERDSSLRAEVEKMKEDQKIMMMEWKSLGQMTKGIE